ncbi:MAG: glutamate N-acetyltransferase / amino-acid N-acetyltransferase [Verrucomicrobiota bacterium]|jgi:glutamate N-acetyltransferase/amino-acid N-acetyltransferase
MFQSHARLSRNRRLDLKIIPGSICAPRGFKCASVFCDIKRLGTGKGSAKGRKDDLALIVSDVPATVAGMFTTNQVCAAPVKVSRKVATKKSARAIVANSGNANAATGRQGMRDAERMAEIAAKALSINRRDVLVCSTGRIGVPLPILNVERGIRACAPLLARSTSNSRAVAKAIMTSDTRRKEIAVECKIDNRGVRIGGIAKGAGMIQPGMATMLAFITSDIAIGSQKMKRALKIAVEQSFNRITVDGDMSTNDSVIMLANGLAGNVHVDLRKFQEALNFVCLELAKMIVRDGEGVSRFVTLHVRGARSDREAELVARAVANSSLVRTSWCGGDPNWGRILCALGYSKAKVNEAIVDVGYSRPNERKIIWGFRRGGEAEPLRKLAKIVAGKEFDIHVDLHLGRGEFTMFASDLTEDYVTFNKGDLTGG